MSNTVYLIDKDEVENAIDYARGEISEARDLVHEVCRNALPTYEPCNRLRQLLGEYDWELGYVGYALDDIKEKITSHKHTFGPLPW